MKSELSETLPALIGTLFFLLIILPSFLIWIPHEILSAPKHTSYFNVGAWRYIVLVPIALGVVIYVWCSSSFVFYGKDTPIPFTPTKKLVVTGLYRYVRNPDFKVRSYLKSVST